MQEVDFPVRILTRGEDDIIIMVSHEPNTAWFKKEEEKSKRDNTREFCNWIRKSFPHVPTEFRYLGKKRVRVPGRSYMPRYRTVNSEKHFVAYGLKRSELMMLKLAFSYKAQVAELGGKDKYETGSYVLSLFTDLVPTDALQKRIDNKVKPKLVKL